MYSVLCSIVPAEPPIGYRRIARCGIDSRDVPQATILVDVGLDLGLLVVRVSYQGKMAEFFALFWGTAPRQFAGFYLGRGL
jgi:hypothetical protein